VENRPIPVVDVIVERDDKVLLIKRGTPPFKGKLAIPGGHLKYGETVEAAAKREILEETGLEIRIKCILGVYSDPERDPRGHRISVVFIADYASGKLNAGDDAAGADWHSICDLERIASQLAFDHGKVIGDYLRHRLNDSTFWSSKDQDL